MKASVLLKTYNQRRYIAQAIESVLCQQVDFDYELVIGDDCSTDGTTDIVAEYQSRYPDIIRLIPRPHNLGVPGNFLDLLGRCEGDYVFTLDGDDYWTSHHKLSTQTRFMDAHPEHAISFHPVTDVYEGSVREPSIERPRDQKWVYTVDDVVKQATFMSALSVALRKSCVNEVPQWMFDLPYGDWPLYVVCAQFGSIGFIDEVMGCRRVHREGFWSGKDPIRRAQLAIQARIAVAENVASIDRKLIWDRVSELWLHLSMLYEGQQEFGKARTAMLRSFTSNRRLRWRLLKRMGRHAVRRVAPAGVTSLLRSAASRSRSYFFRL